MFLQNKTMEWLCKKTTDEQSELLCEARKSTANLRDKFKQCKEELEQIEGQRSEEKSRRKHSTSERCK